MFYIGKDKVNLSLLNPKSATGGKNYSGINSEDGEILAQIAKKWQSLVDKYGPEEPITFVRPHMKSGVGPGGMGGSYMRQVVIPTSNGTKILTWCEMALDNSNGKGLDFRPRRFTHEPEHPLIGLTLRDNIEDILWHSLYDRLIHRKFTYPAKDPSGKPHPKAGKTVPGIYMLDPNDEAADFLRQGEKSAPMWFYLTGDSPISGNRDAVNFLASVWGISRPEAMSDAIVKQSLVQAIEAKEAVHDVEYGYDGFAKAVKSYLSKDDTTDLEMMALVNRAMDRGILKYLSSKLSWYLTGENGVEIKRMCTVSASNANKPKDIIVQHLLNNDEDLTLIQGSVDAKPIVEKKSKRIYIPKSPTPEFFRNSSKDGGMPYSEMKSACTLIGVDSFGKDKGALADILIDYFITQGKTLAPENLLDEPKEKKD